MTTTTNQLVLRCPDCSRVWTVPFELPMDLGAFCRRIAGESTCRDGHKGALILTGPARTKALRALGSPDVSPEGAGSRISAQVDLDVSAHQSVHARVASPERARHGAETPMTKPSRKPSTKAAPAQGPALDRALAARLTRRSTKELQALHAKATGRSAAGMSRDALLRALATAPTRAPERAPGAPEPAQAAPAPAPAAAPSARRSGVDGAPRARDPRLPAPGTVLERSYKGEMHFVGVSEREFEHRGVMYRSLTAVAKAITGYASINGLLFFGLAQRAPAAGGGKQGR